MADQNQPQALKDLAAWVEYQHQQAQQGIAAQTAVGLGLLWPILRFGELDDTSGPWLHAVTLQIERQFGKSQDAAHEMIQGVKWAIEPGSDPVAKIAAPFPFDDVQRAMSITGPVSVKAQMPAPEDDAMANAKVNSTGAGVANALNGGRGEVQNVVNADVMQRKRAGKVIGYKRVTDDNPCYFCAMLASRGATYIDVGRIQATDNKYDGTGNAKVHNHCQCSIVPVYRLADKYDDEAKYFYAQWKKYTKGFGGKEAINEFRKKYVPPPPAKDAPTVDLDSVKANREALIAGGFGATSPQVRWYDAQIKQLGRAA